jgi:GNAT superfamily N-acetyltransferase
MTGVVRAARPQDVAEIYAMVRELAEYEKSLHEVRATERDFETALFGPSPALFGHVVEHTDGAANIELGGFALWFVNFSTWEGLHGIYLEDLYVRPHLRGHGYGKALLSELAKTCVNRGYRRLEWWVLDWNEPALAFYRSIGATSMDEWTVQRVTGEPLRRLAETAPTKPRRRA